MARDLLARPKSMRVPWLTWIGLFLLASTPVLAETTVARQADDPGSAPRGGGAPPEEASQEAREAARGHFAQGLERAGQADYEGALREFTEAYALSAHFAVLYNIGQAQIALGHPLEAVETLSKYLRDGQEQVPSDRRLQVQAQVELLQFLFAELTVTTDRPGALIFIDGREVGRTPLYQSVRLPAGTHTVSAVVQGMAPIVRSVTIAHGERQVVNLAMPATPAVAAKDTGAPAPAQTPAPASGAGKATEGRARSEPDLTLGTPSSGRTLPALAYAAVGIGVALGGAALAVYLGNRGRYQDWEASNAALENDKGAIDHYAQQTANNRLADSLTRDNHLVAGLSIAGGALVAGGLTFLIHDRLRGGREGARADDSTGAFGLTWAQQGSASGAISWSKRW